MPKNRTQNWVQNSSLDVIAEQMWTLNSPQIEPSGLPVTTDMEILEVYYRHKPNITTEPKEVLQTLRDR